MKKIRIHPTLILLLALPLLHLLSFQQTVLLWLSAALHETGHILAYKICGITMKTIVILPFGICATPCETLKLSPKNEAFCAAAGPVVNLFASVLLLALPVSGKNETILYFLYCNLALLAVNLLPILPLDGGRMVYYTLAMKHDCLVCETVSKRLSLIVLCLLLFPTLAALLIDKNPSLAMIWGYLLIYTVIKKGSV